VLEARDWRDRIVYFTEAPALELGGRMIPSDSLRRWSGGKIAKVRWLTLDAFAPYLELSAAEDLDRLRLNENFHPEWGDGWSAVGVVDPKVALLDREAPLRPLPIGTQRYRARIELFDHAKALTPAVRVASPGADQVLAGAAATTIHAVLPPPLTRLSMALGLVEIESDPELPAEIDAALRPRIEELVSRGMAFRRAQLLASHLSDRGVDAAGLEWHAIDLSVDRLEWGEAVGVGDLLQVGARLVVLCRDQGLDGVLDPDDLVFDLWKGARIRRIAQVFSGEGGLDLELARLRPSPSSG